MCTCERRPDAGPAGADSAPPTGHRDKARADRIKKVVAVRLNLRRGPEPGFDDEDKQDCWCHLETTIADQNYEGWRNEIAALADRWVDAVDATTGVVVVHPDAGVYQVAETSYSSANGGASENNEDIFGTGALPWLRSIDDPWTLDAEGNPWSTWTFSFTEAELAAEFGVDRIDGITIAEVFDSGG